MGAILETFGRSTRQEDPVVHFYETFLAAYDPAMREARGVYYTPEPVVGYIVRSVDALLKKHFAMPEGLAEFFIRAASPEGGIVVDPFAGGGAIPLEAARLGCCSYGNDINPVAHIIEKGSVEFPQKYGKPITYTHEEFMALYGKEGVKLYTEKFGVMPTGNVEIPNRLSFDVEFYAKKLLATTEAEVDRKSTRLNSSHT